MASVMEKWQQKAILLEKQLKKQYKETGVKFAKQLIYGAREEVDYSYKPKTEGDVEWWVKYCGALESRV